MPGILSLSLPILLAAADIAVPAAIELPRGGDPALRAWPDSVAADVSPAPEAPPAATILPAGKMALPHISSRFGSRSDPLGGGRRMHRGLDFPGPRGTTIMASADGVVRFAGAAGSYGRMIEIAHGNGQSSRYAHLDRILVRAGTRVEQGEAIALMGSTGRSTGSHLHFEIREDGRAVDPLSRLGTRPRMRGQVAIPARSVHLSGFARARVNEDSDSEP